MTKRIQSFEEFNKTNESIIGGLLGIGAIAAGVAGLGPGAAEKTGGLLGKISKGVKKLGRSIGKTGSDEDLAGEILTYLNGLNTDYVASNDFKKDRIYNPSPGNYVLWGNIFKGDSGTEYRVDVVNASDPAIGLHSDPYRIFISVIVPKKDTGTFQYLPKNRQTTSTAVPKGDEKVIQLDCSQPVSKKIYDKCQEIFSLTKPNAKGRARGGQNVTKPQKGKFFNYTW